MILARIHKLGEKKMTVRKLLGVMLGVAVLSGTDCQTSSDPKEPGGTVSPSKKASVQGEVVGLAGQAIEGAIVIVRVPSSASRGDYNLPDTRTDVDGAFRLTVYRFGGGEGVSVSPDTITGWVIASAEPRGADGLLQTDSAAVTLEFIPLDSTASNVPKVVIELPVE